MTSIASSSSALRTARRKPRLSVQFAAEDELEKVYETYSRQEYDRTPTRTSRPSFLTGWHDPDDEEDDGKSGPQVLASPLPKRPFVRMTSAHDASVRGAQANPQRPQAEHPSGGDVDSDDDLGLDPWSVDDNFVFIGGDDSSRSSRSASSSSGARLGNLSMDDWNPANELEALFGPGVTEDDFAVGDEDDHEDGEKPKPMKNTPPQWVQYFEHPCSDDEGDCTVPWINMESIPGLVEDSEGYTSDESAGPSTPSDELDTELGGVSNDNKMKPVEPLRLTPKSPASSPVKQATSLPADAATASIDILQDSELERLQDELWKLFGELSLDDGSQDASELDAEDPFEFTAPPARDEVLDTKGKYDGLGGGWPSGIVAPRPIRVFAQRHTVPLTPSNSSDDSVDLGDSPATGIFVLKDDESCSFDLTDAAHSSPRKDLVSLPGHNTPSPFLGVTQTMYCKENYSFSTASRSTPSPRRRMSAIF